MAQEDIQSERIISLIKALIPEFMLDFFRPAYHWLLSLSGAIYYGFPSKSLKIIAVTGTKGKSSVVYMITKIFEDAGEAVAMVGSLGFKIKDKTWPNTLKMTMPGRFKLQKFLYEAKKAGVKYVIMEVTSEGIAQYRLTGIDIDCAVMTNLRPEHIESHGSFFEYLQAKQRLFQKTKNIHILNSDDAFFNDFVTFQARKKMSYGLSTAICNDSPQLNLKLLGDFNVSNALAALAVADVYGADLTRARFSLESIATIPGRMELIESKQGFKVVVDYAHTPDSLEAVYRNLKFMTQQSDSKLICVLGSAGGGRDTWKRPVFGKLADNYCDEIILTNEDPYDEDPESITNAIARGFSEKRQQHHAVILDRKQAIEQAIKSAMPHDVVIITGKGSEISMALAHGKQISWSDKKIVEEAIH